MINKIKWGGIRLTLFLLLFNSCVSPEDNAINQPEKNSSSDTLEKTGPEVYSIEISNMKFNPAEVTVHKGDTIVWKNNDMVAHCVTEETTKAWTSSNIAAGASWKMKVDSSADYFCAIHIVMKGKIKVE